MPTSSSEPRAFTLLRELAEELAASAPASLEALLEALEPVAGEGVARAIGAAGDWIHRLESGGPARWQEALESLVAWSADQVEAPEKLQPIFDAFSQLLTESVLTDGSSALDAWVMPALERLGELCVDAMMGEGAR